MLVFAFEVTELVRARQQAQGLATDLTAVNAQRTNADLDNFTYTASHDLKAPISNIGGLLLALQAELPPARRQRRAPHFGPDAGGRRALPPPPSTT